MWSDDERSWRPCLRLIGLALLASTLAGCGSQRDTPTSVAARSAATTETTTVTVSAPPDQIGISGSANVPAHREMIGRSVRGRPIFARRNGDANAKRRILVVGCIHGDERAGVAVTRHLRQATPPAGVALWLVDSFNPDGCAAGTRLNANEVDLNRNSPQDWSTQTGDFPPGPHPLSEPESQAINRFVLRMQPAISIWYHQQAGLVDDSGGDPVIEREYARRVGLPFVHYGDKPGSITSWQNATFPDSTAFVVELLAGPLSQSAIRRHADAVLSLAAR